MIFNFVMTVLAVLNLDQVEEAASDIDNFSIANPMYGYITKMLYIPEKVRFADIKMNIMTKHEYHSNFHLKPTLILFHISYCTP